MVIHEIHELYEKRERNSFFSCISWFQILRFVCSLVPLWFFGTACAADANTATAAPDTVRLPLEMSRGHFVVRAQVNGSNSVWLMLDTGFSISLIDPRLAELLKLQRSGKTTIAGIAGEEQADVFEGAVFDFGGASYAPRRIASLPSDRKRRGRRMEGILGAGFFRRFVVELDPKAKTIQLREPKTYEYSGPGESIPINLRNTSPVVEAAINFPGRPAVKGRFEIDTGCDGGLCLGHDFVEANKLLEASGQVRQFRIIFDYSRQRMILEPYSK